jgi:hypothetical protein
MSSMADDGITSLPSMAIIERNDDDAVEDDGGGDGCCT